MPRKLSALIAAVVILYLALNIVTVRTLRPWVDEAWAGSPAWSMVARGYMGTPSLDTDGFGPHGMKGISRYSYWEPPLYLAIESLWYRIVPFSLESMRALSVLAGLAGLGAWCFVVRSLTSDAWTAALMALLMACDYIAISASSFGRPDAMSFAFQSLAYATFLYWRERNFTLAILVSQTFVVASGLAHPNGGMLSLIGSVFLILFFDRSRIGWRQVLIAGAPYVAGAIGWGVYILKDPAIFISQYSYQTGMRFYNVAQPVNAILSEMERYRQVMGLGGHSLGSVGPHYLKALIFLSYGAALTVALLVSSLRRERSVQVLLGLIPLYLLFYTFLEATKATYYLIYLIYPYTALLAVVLRWLWKGAVVPRPAIVSLVAVLTLVQSAGLLYRARADHYHNDYMQAVAFLRANAHPADLIVGSHELGFELGFQPRFLDDYRLGLVSGVRPDYIVVEEIYTGRFEMLNQQRPEEYVHLRELLKRYRTVYDKNNYRILEREGR